jgi:hypothetical protein
MKKRFLSKWSLAIIIISLSFYGCSNQDEDLNLILDPIDNTGGNDDTTGDGTQGNQ